MVLLQQLLNGLLVGGLYALFAVGLSLTMGVLKIFNLAHAGALTLAAIAAVMVANSTGLPFAGVLAVGAVVGFLVGVLLEFAAFRPLRRRPYINMDARENATLIASIAALVVLESVAQIATDTRYLNFPSETFQSTPLEVAGLSVRTISVVMFVCSLVLTGLVWWFVRATQAGRAVRAIAVDVETAESLGINVNRYTVATLGGAGAMAGIAGVLIGVAFNSVHFLMGETYLLKGMVIMVLGGVGSIPGMLVGGLILGVTEGVAVHYLSSAWRDAIAFGLMFLFLAFRPSGIFGRESVDRA